MFGPGGVFFLLHNELRLNWRRWQSATRKRGRGVYVFWALLGIALLFGGHALAKLLGGIEPTRDPTLLGIIGVAYAVLFSFMLSQALMLITETIYQRGDLDLLLASPLPPWRVLLVRMAAIAINVATFYLILLSAVFIFLPFYGGWRWMAFLPSVLGLALLATGGGLVLARLMFFLFGPKLTRVIAQIVAGFIGAAFFLGMQAQNFVPYEDRAQVYEQMLTRIGPVFADVTSPLSLPARASLGEPDSLAIWLAIGFGGYLLAVWWFASRFIANAAAIEGVGARKRRIDQKTRAIQGGMTATLVRKEWRLLRRDPLLLSQIMLQLLYLIPLFFVFIGRLEGGDLARFSIGGFASAFVLLSTSLAASLAWLTVSAEDAPDLIAAAPLPTDQIDNAKAIAAATPVLTLLIAPVIGVGILAPMAGVWLLIGGTLAIASACLVAIWHKAPGSRKDFRRRRRSSFLISFGQFFVTIGWTVATAMAVSGWALPAIIPALIALGVLLALHESRPAEPPAPKPR